MRAPGHRGTQDLYEQSTSVTFHSTTSRSSLFIRTRQPFCNCNQNTLACTKSTCACVWWACGGIWMRGEVCLCVSPMVCARVYEYVALSVCGSQAVAVAVRERWLRG